MTLDSVAWVIIREAVRHFACMSATFFFFQNVSSGSAGMRRRRSTSHRAMLCHAA